MATVNYDIDAQSDTAMSDANGYQEGFFDVLYVDDNDGSGGWYSCSFRFHGIDLGGSPTINSATLTLARENDNSGSNGVLRCRAEASQTPATFSSGNRPYSRSHRSAYVEHTFPNNGNTQNVDVTSIVQDLVSVYSYNGGSDAMVFTLGASNQWGITPVSWRSLGYALNHASGVVPRLTIDYSTGTSITVTAASITVTGQSVALKRALKVAVTPASAAVTGQDIALKRGLRLSVTPASMAVTGQSVALKRSLKLPVTAGSLPFTGQSVLLKRALKLVCDPAALSFTAQAVALKRGFRLVVAPASLSFTGQAVTLVAGRKITTVPASILLAGQSIALRAGRAVLVIPGDIHFNGQNVTLTYSPDAASYTLVVDPGVLTLAGQSVGLSAGRKLSVTPAVLSLSGQAIALNRGLRVLAVPASLTLAGQTITLNYYQVQVFTQGFLSSTESLLTNTSRVIQTATPSAGFTELAPNRGVQVLATLTTPTTTPVTVTFGSDSSNE